jgi:hypothetical protein
MAGICDTTENAIMALIWNATIWANYAINATTTPETNIVVALHTADPLDAGTQSTSEVTTAAYVGYTRVNVLRTNAGWTVTGGSVSPVANIDFPASTGGTGATITNFSTGKIGGGASAILWTGTITPSIVVSGSGVTPSLTTASTITLD